MNNARLLPALIMLVCLLATAGCWDSKEIDALAIVAAIGIDLSDTPGEYLVSAQLIRPGQMANTGETSGIAQGKPSWVIRTSAETIFKAIRELTVMSSRKLYFPHNQVIVFGRKRQDKVLPPCSTF